MAGGARRTRPNWVAAAVVAVVATGILTLVALVSASAAVPPTAATIIDFSSNTPLGAGGSQTQWSIEIPPQASCSGDTAHGGYHVYGYIVLDSQINSDPSTLHFDPTNGPTPGLPLFDIVGSQYGPANTATNTGQIVQIPIFDYNVFHSTDLPPGLYDVGIACANPTNGVDKFFNVQESFVASSSDPNGFTWTAANPNVTTTTTAAGTTTTTAVGSTTTTATTVAGGTTTTAASTTTTTSSTVAGSTTTTSSTVAGTTSTSGTGTAAAGGSSGVSGQSAALPTTGASVVHLTDWALWLISFGAWALLATWRRRRRTS